MMPPTFLQDIDQHGTSMEIIKNSGGNEQYLQAIRELEEQLYYAA